MAAKRDIYNAIMSAAKIGRGLHLTVDEVYELSLDDAIATRAIYLVEEAGRRALAEATREGETG